MYFFEKKCRKICTYQKKAVPLHPLLIRRSTNGVYAPSGGGRFPRLTGTPPGPLAQLNRVPHYGCGGCRFESCMDHKRVALCAARFVIRASRQVI